MRGTGAHRATRGRSRPSVTSTAAARTTDHLRRTGRLRECLGEWKEKREGSTTHSGVGGNLAHRRCSRLMRSCRGTPRTFAADDTHAMALLSGKVARGGAAMRARRTLEYVAADLLYAYATAPSTAEKT